jgi:hypothetical protein
MKQEQIFEVAARTYEYFCENFHEKEWLRENLIFSRLFLQEQIFSLPTAKIKSNYFQKVHLFHMLLTHFAFPNSCKYLIRIRIKDFAPGLKGISCLTQSCWVSNHLWKQHEGGDRPHGQQQTHSRTSPLSGSSCSPVLRPQVLPPSNTQRYRRWGGGGDGGQLCCGA